MATTGTRRLPPLSTPMDVAQKPVDSSPASAPINVPSATTAALPTGYAPVPYASSRNGYARADIQLTSALTEPAIVPAAQMRRLPPLTTLTPDAGDKPMRRPMPAHIGAQPPGSRPADGVARVLSGSDAVGHRAIILGPPPQPADNDSSSLANVGRSTLRTPGLLPKMLPSPISRSPAH